MRLVDLYKDRLFEWGTHDCVTFSGLCCEAVTGHDPVASYAGQYANRFGSLRLLLRNGARGVGDIYGRFFDSVPINFAKRGDIVMLKTERMDALGVVVGDVAMTTGVNGLVCIDRHEWIAAWSIE